MAPAYNHKSFIDAVKAKYPGLVKDLADYPGLLHLETAVLSRFAQQMVTDNNRKAFKEIVEFADAALENCTPDVDNAIMASFYENLELEGEQSWAYDLLTPKQQARYRLMHGMK